VVTFFDLKNGVWVYLNNKAQFNFTFKMIIISSSISFQLAENAKKIGQVAKTEETETTTPQQDTLGEKLVSFFYFVFFESFPPCQKICIN
jgi:hypothetical protein